MTRTAPRRPRSKRYSPMTGSWSKDTVWMRSGLSTMTIGALVEIAVDRQANWIAESARTRHEPLRRWLAAGVVGAVMSIGPGAGVRMRLVDDYISAGVLGGTQCESVGGLACLGCFECRGEGFG